MPLTIITPATESSPEQVSRSKPALGSPEEKQAAPPGNKQGPKPANKSRTTADRKDG